MVMAQGCLRGLSGQDRGFSPMSTPARYPKAEHMSPTLAVRARIGLASATVLCLLVGGYGLALAATDFGFLPDDIGANALLRALEVHIAASSVALVLVPWQLWPGLRSRSPQVHRWTGRAYVVAAVLGGGAGAVAALGTTHGPVAAGGLGVLGVVWVVTTVAAFRAAMRGDLSTHRRWAIRSFALAFAAVTLRLYLPTAGLLGLSYDAAYPVIAWLCWVPNLLVTRLAHPVRQRPLTLDDESVSAGQGPLSGT